MAVKDAYIEASNAGDADAVLALFEPDVRAAVSIFGGDLVTFERFLVSSIAEGTTVTAENCTARERGDAIRLSCDSTRHAYLAVAVGAPAPEGNLSLSVTVDGIRSLAEANSFLDFEVSTYRLTVGWRSTTRSTSTHASRSVLGDSVAQAEQAGTLHGQYADEWAAYLEENGCTYQDTDC